MIIKSIATRSESKTHIFKNVKLFGAKQALSIESIDFSRTIWKRHSQTANRYDFRILNDLEIVLNFLSKFTTQTEFRHEIKTTNVNG